MHTTQYVRNLCDHFPVFAGPFIPTDFQLLDLVGHLAEHFLIGHGAAEVVTNQTEIPKDPAEPVTCHSVRQSNGRSEVVGLTRSPMKNSFKKLKMNSVASGQSRETAHQRGLRVRHD